MHFVLLQQTLNLMLKDTTQQVKCMSCRLFHVMTGILFFYKRKIKALANNVTKIQLKNLVGLLFMTVQLLVQFMMVLLLVQVVAFWFLVTSFFYLLNSSLLWIFAATFRTSWWLNATDIWWFRSNRCLLEFIRIYIKSFYWILGWQFFIDELTFVIEDFWLCLYHTLSGTYRINKILSKDPSLFFLCVC